MTADEVLPAVVPPVESPTKMKPVDVAEVVEEETGEEITESAPTLEEASVLVSSGIQAYALGKYEEAAEKLSLAVEIQVNLLGQYDEACAPTFVLYGKALLAAAALKNTVLGEKAEQVAPTDQTIEDTNDPMYHEEDEAEDLEDEEGKALDDIELPPTDDLELAWENLDVARLIYSKNEDPASQLKLADVHLVLGDVSLESGIILEFTLENFELAVKDYEIALQLKIKHSEGQFRELAEAHFKLALGFEYSELLEDAIEQVAQAMDCLKSRIKALEPVVEGKGKKVVDIPEASLREIKQLNGFLAEMESKAGGEEIGAPAPTVNVVKVQANDISSLVKTKKTPKRPVDTEAESAKRAKVD